MKHLLFRTLRWSVLILLAAGLAATLLVFAHYGDRATESADCVVAFGAAVWPGDVPSDTLRDRTLTAASLAAAMPHPCLILSGGPSYEVSTHEVDVMRRLATGVGIAPDVILTDYAGVTTRATLANLAPERSYILVSNDFHLARIALLARRYGLHTQTHAADYLTNGRYLQEPYLVLREAAAIIYYGLHLDAIIPKKPVGQGGL